MSSLVGLQDLVDDFASALERSDGARPVWKIYRPGIGPHPETEVVRMIAGQLATDQPDRYAPYGLGVAYPAAPRQKCDWVIGSPAETAVEVKMLRLMGDNGKPNDNMLMHILSPYPAHRSALTDCTKLARSGFECARVVLIYGFDYPDCAMDPAIEAFECLAARSVDLSKRATAEVKELVHPVHQAGRVFAWWVQ